MKYVEPFTFLFKQPHAVMTLVIGTVLFFVPVVGPLVLMGWLVLVHRALMNGEQEIPALTFDDFSRLLNLGLGPFVASMIFGLVLSMILTPAMMIPWFGMGVAMPLFLQGGGDEAVMLIVMAVGSLIFFLFFMGLMIVSGMFSKIILIRAELTPDVNESLKALSFSYIREFFRVAKKELFLATLGYTLGSIVLSFAGMLVLMVGAYPAAVLTMVAGAHFRAQLYAVYLAKGGTPLPVQPIEFEKTTAQTGAPLPYGGPNQGPQ